MDGGDGNDNIWCHWWDDIGVRGSKTFYGGNGNDSLSGGDSDDRLYGGAGNDSLWGWYGKDYMEGGEGSDSMYGGDPWVRVGAVSRGRGRRRRLQGCCRPPPA